MMRLLWVLAMLAVALSLVDAFLLLLHLERVLT